VDRNARVPRCQRLAALLAPIGSPPLGRKGSSVAVSGRRERVPRCVPRNALTPANAKHEWCEWRRATLPPLPPLPSQEVTQLGRYHASAHGQWPRRA
jgi:hypothetical protein